MTLRRRLDALEAKQGAALPDLTLVDAVDRALQRVALARARGESPDGADAAVARWCELQASAEERGIKDSDQIVAEVERQITLAERFDIDLFFSRSFGEGLGFLPDNGRGDRVKGMLSGMIVL